MPRPSTPSSKDPKPVGVFQRLLRIPGLGLLLKGGLAGALVYWLLANGKLDLSQVGLLVTSSRIFFLAIALWFFGSVLQGSLRWLILMRAQGLQITYLKTIQLHLVGIFFNTAMPGAVGGDLVKAVYVTKLQPKGRKTPAIVSIVVDRVMGLLSLFTIACIAIIFQRDLLETHPVLKPFAYIVVLGLLGVIGVAVLAFSQKHSPRDPIARLLAKPVPGFSLLLKIYQAFQSYRDSLGSLLLAWSLGLVNGLLFMAFFWELQSALTVGDMDLAGFVLMTPIGLITVALPIMPGGFGVGHLSFDQFYALLGVQGGGNVFNLYFISQTMLNLLGSIPYIFMRSHANMPSLDELEPGQGEETDPGAISSRRISQTS